MVDSPRLQKAANWTLWSLLAVGIALTFLSFFRSLFVLWTSSEQFSYGIVIPVVSLYLLWSRRNSFPAQATSGWWPGLALALLGCGLQILATLSGTLLLSGFGFVLAIAGTVGFCLGLPYLRASAGPIGLLVLMVPPPGYLVDEITWHLQVLASTVSASIFELLRIPVYQDGNLLKLSAYVLEVKQACSGSRSIFALLALAMVIGLRNGSTWAARCVLVAAAPLLAICTNVVRIVGAGLIAQHWGGIAADESLHAAWGVVVFVVALTALLGVHRLLQWITAAYA